VTWSVTANPKRFEDAIRWFQRRVVLDKLEAIALGADASYRAFWIGGGLELEQVGRVFDEIDIALQRGEPFSEWRERVRDTLRDDVHAETVFRNAVQQAYTAGRHRQMSDPEVLRFRPYWMHDSVLDSRTTEQCQTLDGLIFPVNHPHWRTHWPPGHHRCRRSVRSLRKSEAERRGIATEEPDVFVPEGWGRLPSAAPSWKPKGKGRQRKKLVTELEQKKRKRDAKKPPKAKQKKGTAPPPLVARSKEFEQAVLTGDWAKARGIIREHIEHTLPGTTSKDIEYGRSLASALRIENQANANGAHDWTGEIILSERTHGALVAASRSLSAGTYHDPKTFRTTAYERYLEYRHSGTPDPVSVLDALRTLFHEELHGTTRLIGRNYRGANAVLEEVGVELNARRMLRSLGDDMGKFLGPVQATGIGSYDGYIIAIQKILVEDAPGLDRSKSVTEHITEAFQRGITTKGADFTGQDDYIEAFVKELPAPADERAKVKARLKKLKADHLPESHRD